MSNLDPETSAEAAFSAALRELAYSAHESAPPELGDSLMRSFRHHHRRRRRLRATSLCFIILFVLGGCVLWVRTQSTRTGRSAATIAPNSKPAGQQNPEKPTEPNLTATAVAGHTTLEGGLPTPLFANT